METQSIKETGKYVCPCCGCKTLDEPPGGYDICEVCWWQDDDLQLDDPDYTGGPNRGLSLNQARAYWQKHRKTPFNIRQSRNDG